MLDRAVQNIPERHINVREPVQMPVIKGRFLEKPYLLAVDKSRMLLGPGDHTVRMAERVISIKMDNGMKKPPFGIIIK